MTNMKNIKIAALLLCGLSLLSACKDDNDSNPTIKQPTQFVLNQPALAAGQNSINLATNKGVRVTYSQPDYGYTAAVKYTAQVSLDGNYTKEMSEATEEAPEFDYITLDETFTSCAIDINAEQLNLAVQRLLKYEEDNVPEITGVKLRMHAQVDKYGINSNIVDLLVSPFYVVLKDADPLMFHLVGGEFGWSNSVAEIGKNNWPYGIIDGIDYDKKDGTGKVQFTGYFAPNSEFKTLCNTGANDMSWDWKAFVKGDGPWTGVDRNGGDDLGNMYADADGGYYTATIDTKAVTIEFKKCENQAPAQYSSISLIGLYEDWNTDIDMTPYKDGALRHLWVVEQEITEKTAFKFRADHDWTNNWGNNVFKGPYTIGIGNGPNIPIEPGTYRIMFNDLDGCITIWPLQ